VEAQSLRVKAADASIPTARRLPAAPGQAVLWSVSSSPRVPQRIEATRKQHCHPGSQWRRHGRCPVTRRRRTDHALMIIVRRAERDAGMPRRTRSDEPNSPTTIGPETPRDEPESQHPC
jgi:hypothetical protein